MAVKIRLKRMGAKSVRSIVSLLLIHVHLVTVVLLKQLVLITQSHNLLKSSWMKTRFCHG